MAELVLENAILGKFIVFPYMLSEAIETGLKEEYFLEKDTRDLFRKMVNILETHSTFDHNYLNLEKDRIFELSEISINVGYLPTAIKILKENYKSYVLDNKINDILLDTEKETSVKQKEILQIIESLNDFETEKNKEYGTKELATEWWKSLEGKELDGIMTGYKDLDDYFMLEAGSLVTIGARPATGKTAFGINLAYINALKHDVLYVNLEMNKNQITNRILGSMSSVPLTKIIKKEIGDYEAKKIADKLEIFEKLKLRLLDCTDNNFNVIVQKIKRMHEKNKFKLIVVDYLTLMQAKGFANKTLEVEYMANKLKLLSTELNTCIVVLAQLNRQVEQRADKKPMLSDLRDSGGIEQASNVVCMLYRSDYYSEEQNDVKISTLEVLIRKNRNGQVGEVKLAYNKEIQSIRSVLRQLPIAGDEKSEKPRLYE